MSTVKCWWQTKNMNKSLFMLVHFLHTRKLLTLATPKCMGFSGLFDLSHLWKLSQISPHHIPLLVYTGTTVRVRCLTGWNRTIYGARPTITGWNRTNLFFFSVRVQVRVSPVTCSQWSIGNEYCMGTVYTHEGDTVSSTVQVVLYSCNRTTVHGRNGNYVVGPVRVQ